MKAQVKPHVIEDEMYYPAVLETETMLGISNRGGLIPAASYMGQRREIRSQRGAHKATQRLATAGRRYYPYDWEDMGGGNVSRDQKLGSYSRNSHMVMAARWVLDPEKRDY